MILKETIYLVHTYGKVASKAITKALQENANGKVFHTHYLNPITLEAAKKYFSKNPELLNSMSALKDGDLLSDLIRNSKEKYKWKIISLTREPISWQISMIFELNSNLLPNIFKDNSFDEKEFRKFAISSLTGDTSSSFLNIDFYSNWWKKEINEVFDVDIFKEPFSDNEGYRIYRFGNVEILIIKYEKLSEVFEKAMNDFGVKGFFYMK